MKKSKTKIKVLVGKKKLKIKKRSIFLTFVLLIVLIFALFRFFLPELLFEMGKKTFEAKDYKTSSELFKNAYKFRPENKEYPYYWALSLSYLPLSYNVQADLYKISQFEMNAKAEVYATKVLNVFKEKILSRVGSNYIEEATHDNQVLRWNLAYLPLKYYVDTNIPVPPYYIDLIKKSFLEWQIQTNGMVTFAPAANRQDAQIVFSFVDTDNSKICQGAGCEYSVGNTVPVTESSQLKLMNVKINAKNNLQRYFSPQEISLVMVHEIGHALGIWGHSDNINDIMYYSADQKYGIAGQKGISLNDINTLRLLYSFAPDITNIELSPTQREYFLYAPIFLNDIEKSKDDNIEKTVKEINSNPGDVSGWLELAAKYSSSGEYEKSIAILTKTLGMVQEKEVIAIIYYNMANDYLNLKKYSEAMEAATRAQQVNNDFDTRALIALIESKNGQGAQAEQEFLKLIAEQPQNIDVALNLTDLYAARKDYIKAKKTVKSLVNSNPDAVNDPRLNAYKIYLAF